MRDYENESVVRRGSSEWSVDQSLRDYMVKIYTYMAAGLGITAAVAFLIASNEALIRAIFQTPLRYVVFIAPFIMVFMLSARINRMALSSAKMLFFGYSAVMGISLSSIFLAYSGESIARVFFISSSIFAGMSLYGYTTKRNLASMGSFLIMGLWGLVIASVVNMFMQSTQLQMILSYVGVLLFTGLTAYDVHVAKRIYDENDSADTTSRKAIIGALTLYLDFINLFISLLRVLGNRR